MKVLYCIVFLSLGQLVSGAVDKTASSLPSKTSNAVSKITLRVGFFPNLTHAQALIAQALTRRGKGWFERYLPSNVVLEWLRSNAGPSAMESLISNSIDVSYVGPSPALNLYMRTKGKEVRLLSGAIKGGSGLVLQPNADPSKHPKFWEGKKIATPQYGNTQDIACRAWFAKQKIEGVFMAPTANPDQLTLFKKRQIDGIWTIEPWLSRVVNEGGNIFYSDDQSWTTILVGSQKFCTQTPTLKDTFMRAHEALTAWIKNNMDEAVNLLQEEMKQQTRIEFSKKLIQDAMQRLIFENNVQVSEIQKWVDDACAIHFIPKDMLIPLDAFFSQISRPVSIQ